MINYTMFLSVNVIELNGPKTQRCQIVDYITGTANANIIGLNLQPWR